MKGIIIFLIVFVEFILFTSIQLDVNDSELYHLELSDPSTYTVTCYSQLGSKWKVDNDKCVLETRLINLPGNILSKTFLDVPAAINIKSSGNLETDDYVLFQYFYNNKWNTIDSISGNMVPVNFTSYSYLIKKVAAGSAIKLRLTFKTNSEGEQLWLQCDDIKDFSLGSPFVSGTISPFIWSQNPVVLAYFYGFIEDSKITLTWLSTNEYNNEYFTVEKSKNGYDFETLGNIKGKKYSNTEVEYKYYDKYNSEDKLFYRLKQTNEKGETTLNDIYCFYNISNKNSTDCKSFILPDPCIGKCYLNFENCPDSVNNVIYFSMIDALGNISYTSLNKKSVTQHSYVFDSDNNLKPGIYFVKTPSSKIKL